MLKLLVVETDDRRSLCRKVGVRGLVGLNAIRETSMTPPASENKGLLRRHFEAVNDQDWAACVDTLAEDIVFHQAGNTHRGAEWLTEHYEEFYEAFLDPGITIDDLLAEGDRVAARITNTGTTDGEIPGIDAPGTEIEFSSQLIARVENGVLAELWVVAEQPWPASE